MPRLYLGIPIKDVQDEVNRILRKKIKSIYYDESEEEIAMAYLDAVEKYVPLKSGALRSGAHVEGNTVVYSAKAERRSGVYDYAEYQYMNEFPKRHTPGTYGHWNTHLTTAEKKAFFDEVANIIIKRMNDE